MVQRVRTILTVNQSTEEDIFFNFYVSCTYGFVCYNAMYFTHLSTYSLRYSEILFLTFSRSYVVARSASANFDVA